MADDRQQEMLERYIERVMALQAERGDRLVLEDMKEIARELGMDEEDLAAADAAAHDHLDRGLRHSYYRRWDDAIAELREAAALDPMNVETLHALASAHRERWAATGAIGDGREAADLARRTLAIDPKHDPSYLLLNDLDRPHEVVSAAASLPPARPRRPVVGWLLGAATLLIIVVIGMVVLSSRHRREVDIEGSEPAGAVEVAAVSEDERGGGLPVIWQGAREYGVNLQFQPDGGSDLQIANIGTKPVAGLTLRFVGRDTEGDAFAAIDDAQRPLQPGERRRMSGGLPSIPNPTVIVTSVSTR